MEESVVNGIGLEVVGQAVDGYVFEDYVGVWELLIEL